MTEGRTEIILLARRGPVERGVRERVAGAVCHEDPLEALAEMARPDGAQGLLATPEALGPRARRVLRAARIARPQAFIFLVCPWEEEPRVRELAADGCADGYFIVPSMLAELEKRLEHAGSESRGRTSSEAHQFVPPRAEAALGAGSFAGGVAGAIQSIADSAEQSAQRIVSEGVSTLAALEGVLGASAWVRSAGQWATASAGQAPGLEELPQHLQRDSDAAQGWRQPAEDTWLFQARAQSAGRQVVALRLAGSALPNGVPERWTPAVRLLLALTSSASQREAAAQILATDPETGLASRRYLEHYLAALCRRSAARRREVRLVVIALMGNGKDRSARLRRLARWMDTRFSSAKLARAGATTLAAVFCTSGGAGNEGNPAGPSGLAADENLPEGVRAGSAVFPWDASDGAELLEVALGRLKGRE